MRNHFRITVCVAGLLASVASDLQSGAPCPSPENPWSSGLSLTIREGYDTNVDLQDVQPWAAGLAAVEAAGLDPELAGVESWVSSLTPKLELGYKPSAAFNLTASYAPEIVCYHSLALDDYVAHRGTLNLGGSRGDAVWEWTNAFTYVDGSTIGPVWVRPGDIPAIGAVAVHEREEQCYLRNSFRLTIPTSVGFVRPVAASYFHDFRMEQRHSGPGYVYENHVDRGEIVGGLDVGYRAWENTAWVLGYRYGEQSQFRLFNVDSPYDNRFHRILVGLEGDPWAWLKVAFLVGPDIRSFSEGTPAGFEPDEWLYYVDGKVTIRSGAADTISLLARRFEQPASSSQSMYEDILYDLSWKHTIGEHWAAGAGFRIYGGDWQAPAEREDWIFTPSASLIYTRDASFSAELSCAYDWAESLVTVVPGTSTAFADGREFTRSLVSLSAKYSF